MDSWLSPFLFNPIPAIHLWYNIDTYIPAYCLNQFLPYYSQYKERAGLRSQSIAFTNSYPYKQPLNTPNYRASYQGICTHFRSDKTKQDSTNRKLQPNYLQMWCERHNVKITELIDNENNRIIDTAKKLNNLEVYNYWKQQPIFKIITH